jgi:hypothetical protein
VRRQRQKDPIEERNGLHIARRIETHHEVPPGPGVAVPRGPQAHIADALFVVVGGDFNHGKAGTLHKEAHQAGGPEGTHAGGSGRARCGW